MQNTTDLFIIGGGINGAAIAADAAGRGLSVTLCEKGDLANGTSSASTKLIHGGLRYLELYEFNLVRHALQEREILMRRASYLIKPLEFVMPHEKHLRPAWLIKIGLFLYDHLSKRNLLPGSKSLNLKKNLRGKALLPTFKTGFSYYDCFTDDSRLVILNALSAKENGATILTHTEFVSAQRENNYWKIQVIDSHTQTTKIYYSKALINVAGPWVKEVQKNIVDSKLSFNITLVKGSHIIVPRFYEGQFAYILQNEDNRIVFTIPYQNEFTLIGTTDTEFKNSLESVTIDNCEEEYLCQVIKHYFKKSIQHSDIAWSYSGVRCLQNEDAENLSKITRDYKLLLEPNPLPLLTVIGGKITTHRTLAEDSLSRLKNYFPKMGPSWTATSPLPGGDFLENNFDEFYAQFKAKYSWLPEAIARRYASSYGTRAEIILKEVKKLEELGEEFAPGFYQKEVEYLLAYEWAESLEDILWRRTKLGLFFSENETETLLSWLNRRNPS